MTVCMIIFGMLMVFCGISLMCTPLATFLSAGYFLGIVMFVYGIFGIVRAFQKQSHVFETVMSVLAVIVGVIAMVRPGSTLLLDAMIVYMAACWFVLRGAVAIMLAVQTKAVNNNWVWGLVLGILSLIIGFYSFAHPGVMALATGVLIGLYFIEAGIDMVYGAMVVRQLQK